MEEVTTEWLESEGWRKVGDTWYENSPEWQDAPWVLMYINVDQSLRIAGFGKWVCIKPTRNDVRLVVSALSRFREKQ